MARFRTWLSAFAITVFASCGGRVTGSRQELQTAGAGGVNTEAGAAGQAGGAGSAGSPERCLQKTWPACDACIRERCEERCAPCDANPACVGLVECGILCDLFDGSCLANCAAGYKGGVEDSLALIAPDGCVVKNCQWQCGIWYEPCFVQADAPCWECLEQQCVESCPLCGDQPACRGYVDCMMLCPESHSWCDMHCSEQYPQGPALAQPLVGCMKGACSAACGW